MFDFFINIISATNFPKWLSSEILNIGPLSIKWYGVSYIIAIYSGYYYSISVIQNPNFWFNNKTSIDKNKIPNKVILQDLMFYSLLGIIIGGRVGYIALYNTSTIWTSPLDIFKVWQGGMSFHGGFLGVCLAVYYSKLKNKCNLWRLSDLIAIGAPLGLFAVRVLGNFLNQELYGRVTDVPWAMIFSTDPNLLPRHPSQLYEAFLEGLVIFIFLRYIMFKFKALMIPGLCTGFFIFLYGCFRLAVEFFREPDNINQFGVLTRGMAYSIPMIIIGALIIYRATSRQSKND
ncbi:MAG: prolipoprotein diacylglyceryl transferase [Hellea sp.]|jgi:phosphatidylglycerol:prolipoprotein diacylglycerol transferase|nr:prolipoprotein diacylglyceryl transferase [Hellea sp.]